MDEQNNKSSVGSIIGIIIIIALIVLGGLYFWGKRIEESKFSQNMLQGADSSTTTVVDESQNEANVIRSINPSDDLDSIDTDLQHTNTTNLSTELNVTATSTQ